MENKYYTPSLDEFHQDFEYEWNYKNKGWEKDKFDISTGDTDCMAGDYYEFHPNNPNTICRVKSLDREDIESLGWKYEKTYPGLTESFYSKEIGGPIDWIGLEHDTETNYLRIFYSGADGDNTVFQGSIRNKSELKRLLTQVGITN